MPESRKIPKTTRRMQEKELEDFKASTKAQEKEVGSLLESVKRSEEQYKSNLDDTMRKLNHKFILQKLPETFLSHIVLFGTQVFSGIASFKGISSVSANNSELPNNSLSVGASSGYASNDQLMLSQASITHTSYSQDQENRVQRSDVSGETNGEKYSKIRTMQNGNGCIVVASDNTPYPQQIYAGVVANANCDALTKCQTQNLPLKGTEYFLDPPGELFITPTFGPRFRIHHSTKDHGKSRTVESRPINPEPSQLPLTNPWPLFTQKKFQEAIDIAKQCINVGDKQPHLYECMFLSMRDSGKKEEALKIAEQLITMPEYVGRGYKYKCEMLHDLNRRVEALECYRQASNAKDISDQERQKMKELFDAINYPNNLLTINSIEELQDLKGIQAAQLIINFQVGIFDNGFVEKLIKKMENSHASVSFTPLTWKNCRFEDKALEKLIDRLLAGRHLIMSELDNNSFNKISSNVLKSIQPDSAIEKVVITKNQIVVSKGTVPGFNQLYFEDKDKVALLSDLVKIDKITKFQINAQGRALTEQNIIDLSYLKTKIIKEFWLRDSLFTIETAREFAKIPKNVNELSLINCKFEPGASQVLFTEMQGSSITKINMSSNQSLDISGIEDLGYLQYTKVKTLILAMQKVLFTVDHVKDLLKNLQSLNVKMLSLESAKFTKKGLEKLIDELPSTIKLRISSPDDNSFQEMVADALKAIKPSSMIGEFDIHPRYITITKSEDTENEDTENEDTENEDTGGEEPELRQLTLHVDNSNMDLLNYLNAGAFEKIKICSKTKVTVEMVKKLFSRAIAKELQLEGGKFEAGALDKLTELAKNGTHGFNEIILDHEVIFDREAHVPDHLLSSTISAISSTEGTGDLSGGSVLGCILGVVVGVGVTACTLLGLKKKFCKTHGNDGGSGDNGGARTVEVRYLDDDKVESRLVGYKSLLAEEEEFYGF